MSSPRHVPRSEPQRTLTWPPLNMRLNTNNADMPHTSASGSQSVPPSNSKPLHNPFEEDINRDPQSHFLSPVQMHEAWDESESDDGSDVEWDAGIVDFALFTEEKKRFEGKNLPLPRKWEGFLTDQAHAYQRAVGRTRVEASEPAFLARTSSGESLPDLTPDSSPNLRDNLEYDEDSRPSTPPRHSSAPIDIAPRSKPLFPKESTTRFWEETTGSAIEEEDEDDADVPLSFYVSRGRAQRESRERVHSPPLKLQRPGLHGTRTLSGKAHSWKRPAWGIWSVEEQKGAEEIAQLESGEEAFAYLKTQGMI